MKVQTVIDMAIGSELSNLNTKNDIGTIMSFINLGMVELYKRFQISTKEHVVTLESGVSIYDLPSDCMWIVAAYDESYQNNEYTAVPVGINEEDNPMSINTIGWGQIQVPVAIEGAYISIMYIAEPEAILPTGLEDPIKIPSQMVEALLQYVGIRANSALDANEEVAIYERRFELSCKRIKSQGMATADDLSSDKFRIGGYV